MSNQSTPISSSSSSNNFSNRLICVLAATGKQGKSVCKHLIDAGFKVRGTTRDSKSKKCDELKSMGVEIVQADMDEIGTMVKAFNGCWGVYSVTDFYQEKVKNNPELEYIQGKNAVDAGIQSGVQYFMYSSLDNVKNISDGKLSKVFHFTNKNRVEQYLRQKTESYSGMKGLVVYPAFYMQNFSDLMPAQRNAQDEVVFSFPFPGSVLLPIVDCEDFGKVVTAMFKNPDTYASKKETLMCGDYLSLNDIVQQFKQATNQQAIYHQATEEEMRSHLPADLSDEFMEMFRWFSEYGYYGNHNVEEGIRECSQIVQQDGKRMNTWRGWLQLSGWKGPERSMLQNIKQTASNIAQTVKHTVTGQ